MASGYNQLGIMGNGKQARWNLQVRDKWTRDATTQSGAETRTMLDDSSCLNKENLRSYLENRSNCIHFGQICFLVFASYGDLFEKIYLTLESVPQDIHHLERHPRKTRLATFFNSLPGVTIKNVKVTVILPVR